jgi:hypothetical protein
MRFVFSAIVVLVLAGCAEKSPSSPEPFTTLESVFGPGVNRGVVAPLVVFNATMVNALEVPACPSESKGNAHIAVHADGSIHSDVHINNKGGETVRFGHIHHLNPGGQTGPIIWWVSAPVGQNLLLTDRQLRFREVGAFNPPSASQTHFQTHDEALAELLANPQDFYVNFHSEICPGGFARGFLN